MNHLPVEVLLNVFSFVPKEELVTSIPQVCRRWKEIATDPRLFRTLELVNDVPDTRTSIRLLSAARWLTSLNLYGRSDTDVLIQHIGVNHPRLLKLVIDKCRGSRSKKDVSAMQLRYLVLRCSTLQQFSLLETLCYSNVLQTEIGVNLHDLRVIKIWNSLKVDLKALISITNHCNRIEKIHLEYEYGYYGYSEYVVTNFCDKFKDSLTSFELPSCWTIVSLTALSRCRNVKELTLHGLGNITDDGIMTLCEMRKLESLAILQSMNITSTGWVRLFENSSMKSLVKLSLCIWNLDDLVATAISLLPNLKDLKITRSYITDVGLLSISNIPNLARLTIIYGTQITSNGWISFFENINVQQKMTHLKLLRCRNLNLEVAQVIVLNLQKLQQLELVPM